MSFSVAQLIAVVCVVTASLSNAFAAESVGVIDNKGATIIPCQYHEIRYTADGFFAEAVDQENPEKSSKQSRLFDYSGKLLKSNVDASQVYWTRPAHLDDNAPGYKIVEQGGKRGLVNEKSDVVLPKEYCEITHMFGPVYAVRKIGERTAHVFSTDGQPSFTLPAGTIGVARLTQDKFICRAESKEPELQDYFCINRQGIVLFRGSSHSVLTDLGVVQLSHKLPGKRIEWQIIDDSGNIIQPFQRARYAPVTSDRIIKFECMDHFSPIWWKHPQKARFDFDRRENFANFLFEYDLIGMSKTDVEKLLGPSEGRQGYPGFNYCLSCGDCGNSATYLEIELKEERVSAWRLTGAFGQDKGHWVSTNVLLERNPAAFLTERFAPKYH